MQPTTAAVTPSQLSNQTLQLEQFSLGLGGKVNPTCCVQNSLIKPTALVIFSPYGKTNSFRPVRGEISMFVSNPAKWWLKLLTLTESSQYLQKLSSLLLSDDTVYSSRKLSRSLFCSQGPNPMYAR